MGARTIASKSWVLDFTMSIGNTEHEDEATEGFGIYYLRQMPRADPKSVKHVITKPFDGIGLIFDAYTKQPGMQPGTNMVYMIKNDDTVEDLDPFRDSISQCSAEYRNIGKVNIRIKYDRM